MLQPSRGGRYQQAWAVLEVLRAQGGTRFESESGQPGYEDLQQRRKKLERIAAARGISVPWQDAGAGTRTVAPAATHAAPPTIVATAHEPAEATCIGSEGSSHFVQANSALATQPHVNDGTSKRPFQPV